MKIKRYNSGGGIIYTPFVSSIGLPQQTSSGSKTESKTSAKEDDEPSYWDKEFLKTIQQYALPSDYAADYPTLVKKIAEMQSLSNTSLLGGTKPSTTMADILQVQLIANRWKSERETWEKASELVSNEKAGNEAAITSRGNIYVYSDKGITTVTPEEYAKDIEKYYGNYITNSELLEYRRADVPHQGKMIADASRVIGLQTIHKQLLDTIKEFSTETISEYVKRTGNHVSQSAWRGMKILLGEGPDGYYKITTKSELTDVNAAVKYLWDSIGEDGQAKLKAQTAIKGGDPNKPEDRYEFILSMLQMHTDYSQELTFEKGATEYDPDGDGKGTSTQLTEDDLAERYLSGSGAPPPKYEILMTSKSGVPMYAYVQNLGGILNSSGNASLGDANLEDVFTNGYSLSTDVDKKSITFGDQLIDWSDASKIIYDSSTSLKRVYLPARNVNGRITPDFEMYKTISQLNETFKDLDAGTIKDYLAENYPALDYDEKNKMIVAKNTQLFLTFGAIASTDTFSKDMSKSDWLIHDESIDRKWKDKYNGLTGFRSNTSIGTKSAATGNKETKNGWMPWNWGYDFYKGNVFVAVTDPMLASMIHNNQYWSKDTYRAMTQKAEAAMRESAREQQSQLKLTF